MAIYKTKFDNIPLFRQGKVRDVYDLGQYLLFVATDRISAFDVIMEQPIPHKGKILTNISKYWFNNTQHIIPNHFISTDINDYPEVCMQYKSKLAGRSMLVQKTKPIMLECVVRGYLAGSGWKEYKNKGTVCDIALPAGLQEYSKLLEPIFTPSTKAEEGHDENINFQTACEIVGAEVASKLKEISIKLYLFAWEYLMTRNLILADTKFEFGFDKDDNIILIDEVLTPDSSRFWVKTEHHAGKIPYNFDKQILRDYLESIQWNKQPPPPILPQEIIEQTQERYKIAEKKITTNSIFI